MVYLRWYTVVSWKINDGCTIVVLNNCATTATTMVDVLWPLLSWNHSTTMIHLPRYNHDCTVVNEPSLYYDCTIVESWSVVIQPWFNHGTAINLPQYKVLPWYMVEPR